jgi:hypothetical protein
MPTLELYTDESRGFALFKPKDWNVGHQQYSNGFMIAVTAPSGDTMVSMSFLTTTDRGSNSVNFAGLTFQNVRSQIPDLKLNWSRTTEDRRRTVIEAQYTNAKGSLIHGRYYFLMSYPEARFFACEAPRRDSRTCSFCSILTNPLEPDISQSVEPMQHRPRRLPEMRAIACLTVGFLRALQDGA